MDAMDDPPMDILSKSIAEPGSDPGGGGGIGSGAPSATSMGAVVGGAGFTTCWAMGTGAFTTLACACGVIAHVVGGTGANRVTMGGGGKEYVWRRGSPNGIGATMGGGVKFSCGGYGIGFIP